MAAGIDIGLFSTDRRDAHQLQDSRPPERDPRQRSRRIRQRRGEPRFLGGLPQVSEAFADRARALPLAVDACPRVLVETSVAANLGPRASAADIGAGGSQFDACSAYLPAAHTSSGWHSATSSSRQPHGAALAAHGLPTYGIGYGRLEQAGGSPEAAALAPAAGADSSSAAAGGGLGDVEQVLDFGSGLSAARRAGAWRSRVARRRVPAWTTVAAQRERGREEERCDAAYRKGDGGRGAEFAAEGVAHGGAETCITPRIAEASFAAPGHLLRSR